MKICKKCNIEKNITEFHKFVKSKDGLYSICKDCKREYDKIYRRSDKIQSMYKSPEYISRKIQWRNENYLKVKLCNIKSRLSSRNKSSGRNLEFNISAEDLVIPKFCPLLGIELDYKIGSRCSPNAASIDRIDNSLGYVKGNVWIISNMANLMKSNSKIDQLILFSENVLKIFKNKNDNN